ncbi:hypothetical protein [Cryptosporangium sp. NPDC048952]|uniref:hypothetical protein n=1 Tax=Cryptosporangium sp. NPDC048952 TaxID=3363961 RepID=UPI0037156A5D
MLRTVLLSLHIAAGSFGLLVGPVAMLVRKRRGWHTRLGIVYQGLVAALCLTGFGLVAINPDVWWLAAIGAATWAAASIGWWVRRRQRPGWVSLHVSFMCGSYVSFLTAFLVNVWGSPLSWIIPTIVGSPWIAYASARAGARPRRTAPA